MAETPKKRIFVKWVRSGIAFPKHQKEMVRSLGLGRLHQVVSCPDSPQVRGLIQRIHHLVEIVDEPKPPAWLSVPEYTIIPPPAVEKAPEEAAAPKAEEEAAEVAGQAEQEPEAAAKPKKVTKPAAAKHQAKAAEAAAAKKKTKSHAAKSHPTAKKTGKK